MALFLAKTLTFLAAFQSVVVSVIKAAFTVTSVFSVVGVMLTA